ncbi:TPA: hypothetical protein DF272_01860 [Candidatus Falkowbacteria bacterium]|nr:hypothetical protein [Candidatus Falkowbacteria bacterium]
MPDLMESAFLHGLNEQEVFDLLQFFEVRHFLKGAVLLTEGVVGEEMLLIVSGRVSVKFEGHYIKSFGMGSVMGEISLIDHGERTASVIAETDVEVRTLSTSAWLRLRQERPDLASRISFNLNCIIAQKFRSSYARMKDLHREVHKLEAKLDSGSLKRIKKILTRDLF